MSDEDNSIEKRADLVNVVSAASVSSVQVRMTYADASQQAVQLAQLSIAIPAQELTKQAQETTIQTRWGVLRVVIEVAGSVTAIALSPSTIPWAVAAIAIIEVGSFAQAWLKRPMTMPAPQNDKGSPPR